MWFPYIFFGGEWEVQEKLRLCILLMLRRVSDKLVWLHVFDLFWSMLLWDISYLTLYLADLFSVRSFCSRKLGKQTQELGIPVGSYSFVNAHMVWHLIVKTACSDHAICFHKTVLGLGTGHSQRLLFSLPFSSSLTQTFGRPGRWVLHPLAWISWVLRVAWRTRCMCMGWDSTWWCLMWLCMVVSGIIMYYLIHFLGIIKDKTARNVTDILACSKAQWDETCRSMWKCHWNIAQAGQAGLHQLRTDRWNLFQTQKCFNVGHPRRPAAAPDNDQHITSTLL